MSADEVPAKPIGMQPVVPPDPADANLPHTVPEPQPTAPQVDHQAGDTEPSTEATSAAAEPPADISRPAPVVPPGVSVTSLVGPETEYLGGVGSVSGMPRDHDVPTLAEIREKIEGRWARAEGQAVLDADSEAGRHRADDEAARAKAAEDVLARIRASLHGDPPKT
jgi:hypothetical protein